MENDIFKPGDGCILRVYEGADFHTAIETFRYIHNLIIHGKSMDSRDDIPFNYKPTNVKMMTAYVEESMTYIVKVEGVLI